MRAGEEKPFKASTIQKIGPLLQQISRIKKEKDIRCVPFGDANLANILIIKPMKTYQIT